MALLLRHLRQANVMVPPPAATGSDIDLIGLDYESLLGERSFLPSGADVYPDVARRFLSQRFPRL